MDVVVGRVAKAHGIRGELVVDVRTDSPEERFAVGSALGAHLRDGTSRTVTVAAARPHAGRLLVRFEGVTGRDAAEAMRGALLTVDTAALPPTEDPDEFYDHELEGLVAELEDGTTVGRVTEVVHGPAGELLVLAAPDGREILVPFVGEIVPEVDVAGGRLVLTPPPGLLDEA
ncbi:16S rRNA processing protein RimM [Streptoalloteichus tenebrarius]|uniref:Ribosome maturation factor RimM n=1 Tax=Streptoalloteichus tenebrarius (strain ATCC 17920 / DSM 40477 / JCM 4838 / CBS 697.72 / NBRC 16177 / NCIMB 11028 / NRRL B-12390 / A12253. 1 / ISP 5477) TaxID=1933 RepID=A0ABT1I3N3_STRSD|nr:ribosome maturation factor RimM [Streptoalloteichus tenebrarius]MCP2262409.1 16S rRNA processing protein RimM [Streptoalloteichus tenebrarius]BFF03376.1 ribosome maturation factor RimM [Streptoalloteichus tenebrarius]